jgi:hypothetical protein
MSVEDVDADRIVARVLRAHLAALDRLERLAVRADNDTPGSALPRRSAHAILAHHSVAGSTPSPH